MRKLCLWLCISAFLPATLDAANLTWLGTDGSVWDTGTTPNWNNNGSQDVFVAFDNVTFDDSSANGTVTLAGALQPGSITVNNNVTAYTFGGTGEIEGSTSLLKSGTGTLTIETSNSFTGGTDISSGTIIITNSSALGSGTTTIGDSNTGANNAGLLLLNSSSSSQSYSKAIVVGNQGTGASVIGETGAGTGEVTINSTITLNNNATFQSTASGTLNLTGIIGGTGTAIFTGGGVTLMGLTTTSGSSSTPPIWTGGVSVTGSSALVATGSLNLLNNNRNVNIGAGSAIAENSSFFTGTLGMLTGSGNFGSNGGTLNLAVGGSNASSEFDGVIGGTTVDGYSVGSSVNLFKVGAGTLTLTGASTYTGSTSITQGVVAMSGNGSIAGSPLINLASGAVLNVSGLNSGAFSLGGSQTLIAGRTSSFATDITGNLATSGTVNIAGTGTAGTLTISGNLALNGGTLLYDLATTNTAGSGVNDLISIGGSLSLSGMTTIVPNLLGGSLSTGTYTLVSGGTAITAGTASDLAWGGSLVRQSVTFNTTTTPGTIYMIVSGSAANLVWLGTNGSTWDTDNTANWNNNGSPDKFYAGDNVTFNDSSSNGTVTLSGSLQPGSVTVSNTATAYTFGGSGQIGGSTSLLKSGPGTLAISTTNSYTGGTVISSGTIILSNVSALGSGTLTLGDVNTGTNNASALITSTSNSVTYSNPIVVSSQGSGTAAIGRTGASGGLVTISSNVTFNRAATFLSSSSGTLALTGAFTGSGSAIFSGGGVSTMNVSSGGWTGGASVTGSSMLVYTGSVNILENNGNLNVGAGSGYTSTSINSGTLATLTGSGYVGGNGASTLNIAVGGNNASSEFDGVIGGATVAGYSIGSSVNLTKTGSGTFTMTGASTYTGTTSISQGTLAISGNGSISDSPLINITPGAALNVSGLTSGTFSLGSGQTLLAGRASSFATDITGNLATSGTVNIAGSGTAGTLTVNGNLALNGGVLLYDLAGATTAGSGVNDLISLTGTLSLSGITTITPELLSGSLSSGTYTLVSGGSAISSGNASDLAWGGSLVRQSVTFNTTTTPGTIYMIVTGSAANLVWSGTNGSTWDTANTVNWSNNGSPDKFYAGDNVTFNDTSSNGAVTLSGSLQPGSVTVNNNATAYTFSGAGQIGGLTSLLKSGTGALTISTTNSYTGGTVISSGTIFMSNPGALGSGTITLGDVNTGTSNVAALLTSVAGSQTFSRPIVVSSQGTGPATIGFTGAGGELTLSSTLTLNRSLTFQSSSSGTLNVTGVIAGSGSAIFSGGAMIMFNATTPSGTPWTGGVSVTGSSELTISSGSLTNLLDSDLNVNLAAGSTFLLTGTSGYFTGTLGMLTGGGQVSGGYAGLTVGAGNASSQFDGVIGSSGGSFSSSLSLTKTGSGTFTLTGSNNYTGTTEILQGVLALSGTASIASTPTVYMQAGAALNVSGLTSGTFAMSSSQTLIAGRTSGFGNDVVGNLSSAGTVYISGDFTETTHEAGTLTVSGNLGLNNANLLVDLAGTTTAGSGVNSLISIGGSLSLVGTTTLMPDLYNSALATGTYTLISGSGGITAGSAANIVWGGPLTRQTISFNTTATPGTLYMVVGGSAADLAWSGTAGSTWNTSTDNWSNESSSGTSSNFYELDNVMFNDSAANGNVTLSGSLQPGSVTVNNNSTAYTLGGTGQITGAAGLTKTGSGSLTINGTESYTGATQVNNGSLTVNGNITMSSTLTVSAGASLTGHGMVGLINGSGTLAPGDPQILTGSAVDPSGGMSFSFQFGQSGSPNYANAASSGNDVLHITGATPFVTALTAANTVTVDFTGLTLTQGEIFYGGIFTDSAISSSMESSANFVYTDTGGATVQFEGLTSVPNADFETGDVTNGEVMEFEVVPEPGSYALLGLGALALLLAKRGFTSRRPAPGGECRSGRSRNRP